METSFYKEKSEGGTHGRYLVAARVIPKGTKILEETPILFCSTPQPYETLTWALTHQLLHRMIQTGANYCNFHIPDSLPPAAGRLDKSIISLVAARTGATAKTAEKMYRLVVANNLLIMGPSGKRAAGIFTTLSHINHSCRPNARIVTTHAATGKSALFSTRDIQEGEEITFPYAKVGRVECTEIDMGKLQDVDLSTEATEAFRRIQGDQKEYEDACHKALRDHLSHEFGFDCLCSYCKVKGV